MKIIFIVALVTPYRVTFFDKLSKRFTDFTVFSNTKEKEDGRPQYDGKVSFKSRGFPERKIPVLGFSVRIIEGMFEAIRKERPDILVVPGIPGNLTYRKIVNWAKKNNTRIVLWHSGWESNPRRFFLLKLFKKSLALSFFKKADYIITYSSAARNDLLAQKFNPDKILVAYNGIELDNYNNIDGYLDQAKKLREKFAGKKRTYLFVGGLTHEKRILFLLDAFIEFNSGYPDTQLWIVGDGPQRAEVEKKMNNHPDIKFFGRIIENVEPYFIAADFFVLPGPGGLALNQAMFFNTPCIAGRADGTEKDLVIEGVTGFNFIEDNKSSLISKLAESYHTETGSLNLMKEKGKELIVKKNNVNYMVSVFHEVLARNGNRVSDQAVSNSPIMPGNT
jgi:glycosyltransferase involved in cell wall biosynthesis